ncbi:MAG: hypothetical protein K2I96_04135 [Lachnospiraceae bacterium]|nr:hypothetical protein [Lachnospiraceae bacterium]
MIDADETRRTKARQLRYKKPIVRDLNLNSIKDELFDIQGECEDVHWYFDTDDDTLINALDGNEDEAYEFKTMFGDLCAECEKMQEDLREEWIPDCFDILFVAAGAGDGYGGILGYDSYEQDYFGISCTDAFAEDEAQKQLKRMTKDDLIAAVRQCFKVYQSFMGIRHRYDCLKAAMDILRDQNTGYLQMVKQIEELYDKADEDTMGFKYTYGKYDAELDRFLNNLPQEAWIQ